MLTSVAWLDAVSYSLYEMKATSGPAVQQPGARPLTVDSSPRGSVARMRITRPSAGAVALIAAVGVLALFSVASAGAAESVEQRGQALLQAVDNGQRNCADVSAADFEAIGEFAMGRMLGSPQAHESMDQLATQMMGADGLERMHQVMGERFAACGQPDFPGGFGQMMSMMPGMGGTIGSPGGGSMMGGGGYGPSDLGVGSTAAGPGSMMGPDYQSSAGDSDDDDDSSTWMAVAMLAMILGAGALAYFLVRRRPRASGALDVLSGRFAAGEMSAEEYTERRRLLQGGSR